MDEKKKDDPLEAKFTEKEPKEETVTSVSFFQLYRYATGLDRFLLFSGIIFTLVAGGVQSYSPVLFGEITGNIVSYVNKTHYGSISHEEWQVATDEFLDEVRYFTYLYIGVGVVLLLCNYTCTAAFNYSANRQILKIRDLYLKKMFNQDISWYDVHQTGDFSSRMTEDLYKLEDGIGEKVPMFLNFVAIFISSLTIALVKGWELALICLTSLPVSVIIFGVIGWLTTKLSKKELDAYGAAAAIAEEVLSSIRTVVAFSGQHKEMLRYNRNLSFARKNNIKRDTFQGMAWGSLWLIIYGSYALAFWYGVKLILEEKGLPHPTYSIKIMITVFFSVMTGSMNFGMASPYLEAFSIAKAAGGKIFSVIDNTPIINLSKNKGQQLKGLKGNITFKNVEFHYPARKDVTVLKDVDLEIRAGETVALVGSSGCGKSTIVQLVQRFYDPTAGEILLDGTNLKDLNLTWLRDQIGSVGQEPVLFATTIKENIKYGNPIASDQEIIEAAKKANAHGFISKLPNGYNTLVGERGAQLSGGQKQRIAIARALIRNPVILLLDEATSALDNTSEAKVQAAIDSASKNYTTIVIAHRLSTIRNANKILVFSNGKVVEEGTHDELMALKKEYYRLVMTQVAGNEEVSDGTNDNKKEGKAAVEEEEETVEIKQAEDTKEVLEEKESISLYNVMMMNGKEWPYILIGCVNSTIFGCAMPLFAVIFGDVIGVLANPDDDYVRSETNKTCIYFIVAGVVLAFSTVIQHYCFGAAGEKMTERIRRQMFQSMLIQEMGFFDRKENGVGALCAQLSSDAASVQGATGQRIGTIVSSMATLVFAVGLSMYYEWRLGLTALAFSPLMLLAVFFERRNTSGLSDSREKSLQKSTQIAVEGVSNIRTVASLSLENTFHQIYVSELLPYYHRASRTIHWRGFVYGMARTLMFFAYAACMFYGGYLITDGLPYERVFKVSQALIMGTVSIANSLAFTPNFTRGIKAAKNVKRFLNRIPLIRNHPNCKTLSMVSGNVKYSDIHFSYPTRPNVQVLSGLDLEVLQGKTVALVGQSGCGKSTVVQLIERFYDPDSGQVFMDDEDIKTVELNSLRSHIGIVSQEPNLFSKTIAENIAYGDNSREVNQEEIIEAAKNANVHNFIVDLPLGYETKLGEKGTQLSGGQKQRIAIARALVRNPKVLLLDEATSALDSESEKVVQEALDRAKLGRTCITIAHRLSTIQDADLICIISKGKVVEMGTHKELLQLKGLYYQLQTPK
ncbi:unnamed protein product [Callosobruchus maculatus]|uniref:ABC-type xenobiotic transporter n=2 Tax=Callosobruchus maculatus TaxID=64391 RepID=A0A653BKK4_CALMS|nr:unnamed protein product [Callosobruchus maculatus]